MTSTPPELRLLIHRRPDGQRLLQRVSFSPDATSSPVPFIPPLSRDDHCDLAWYLEAFEPATERLWDVERRLEAWGRDLHRQATDGAAHGVGIVTVTSDDPGVMRIPWEILRDGNGVLALRGVVVRRALPGVGRPAQAASRQPGLPMRVLFVVSRPDKTGPIEPRASVGAVLDVLDSLGAAVDVAFCHPPTAARLEAVAAAALRAGRPFDVVHFYGHGDLAGGSEKIESGAEAVGILKFERGPDDRALDAVGARRVGDFLTGCGVRLVVLAACRGAALPGSGRGVGTAMRLLSAGVPSVLAMTYEVAVEGMRLFTRAFYARLVEGATVGRAVGAGRTALAEDAERSAIPECRSVQRWDWLVPVLYQSGPDAALIPEDAPHRSVGQPQSGTAGPLPPEPAFLGREDELSALEGAWHHAPVQYLCGPEGVGKTALARAAAAWWVRTERFPQGAAWVDLSSCAGEEDLRARLASFAPAEAPREDLDLTPPGAGLLVVLDGFDRATDACRRLVERTARAWARHGRDGSALLVCGRAARPPFAARTLRLGGLSKEDALLLACRLLREAGLDPSRHGACDGRLRELLWALQNNPLCLQMVVPLLARRSAEELTTTIRAHAKGGASVVQATRRTAAETG